MANYPELEPFRDDIYTCNRTRCGFCSVECPVYRAKRLETYASRGRMLVARGLLEGILEPSAEIQEVMDECLMCGYCQARCALHNMEIFQAVRREMRAAGYSSAKHERTAPRSWRRAPSLTAPRPTAGWARCPSTWAVPTRPSPRRSGPSSRCWKRWASTRWCPTRCAAATSSARSVLARNIERAQARFRQVYGPYLEGEILTVCPTCTATLHDEYTSRPNTRWWPWPSGCSRWSCRL
jgi:Fe-S oxidoreductase